MIAHKATITVNRPAADVFKFVGTDYFTNHPKWDKRVVSLELGSSGPVAVGTQGKETRKQGGRTIGCEFQVSEFKPNSLIAFKAHGGPAKLSFAYSVKPVGDKQAQLDVDVSMQMGGIMRLMEPFMAGSFRKEFDSTVAEIKRMMEQ